MSERKLLNLIMKPGKEQTLVNILSKKESKRFYEELNNLTSSLERLILIISYGVLIKERRETNELSEEELEEVTTELNWQIEITHNQLDKEDVIIYENLIKKNDRIMREFINIYKNKNFYIDKFRGDFVEYAFHEYLVQKREGQSQIFHEPTIYYKQDKLVPENISGEACLVDFVEIREDECCFNLYECKANINNFISSNIEKLKQNTHHKLSYMNYLAQKVSSYYNRAGDLVKTNKYFISLKEPNNPIHYEYQSQQFVKIDLLLEMRQIYT